MPTPFTLQLRNKIDFKTKPLGALGMLEGIAEKIAKVQQTLTPELKVPSIIVFAGDHGIASEGVSAYPQEVTYQMVSNFLNGGAAINVFAQQHGITLRIVDAGVNFSFDENENLLDCKVAKGTQSFLKTKAMSEQELQLCFEHGEAVVSERYDAGCNIIGFGEMGIGNTSAAAMIMSEVTGLALAQCVGRGTGLSTEQYEHKLAVLQQCQHVHGPLSCPQAILQTYGGFEMAQMCAAMLAAQRYGMTIMVDGFIASAAFLIAWQMQPAIINHALFCHTSDEQGHRALLAFLGAEGILNLNMRLGEGSACALAYPLIVSATAFLNDMASFDGAGVSNKATSNEN